MRNGYEGNGHTGHRKHQDHTASPQLHRKTYRRSFCETVCPYAKPKWHAWQSQANGMPHTVLEIRTRETTVYVSETFEPITFVAMPSNTDDCRRTSHNRSLCSTGPADHFHVHGYTIRLKSNFLSYCREPSTCPDN